MCPDHRHAVPRQLPADKPGDGVERRRGRGLGGERAEDRDARRARVEALRVCADDRKVDAARATLVDPPEAVDEEVVADVVPALRVAVVLGDRQDDRRRVVGPVGVRAVGVMDESHLDRALGGPRARHDAIAAPGRARDDRRLPAELGGAGLGCRRAGAGDRVGRAAVRSRHRSARRGSAGARRAAAARPRGRSTADRRRAAPCDRRGHAWRARAAASTGPTRGRRAGRALRSVRRRQRGHAIRRAQSLRRCAADR